MNETAHSLQVEGSSATARNSSRTTPREAMRDRHLTAQVKAALIRAEAARDVLIEANNGIVTLSGSADSDELKRMTLATARSVHGVVSVLDHLFLKGVLRGRARRGRPRHPVS